jgi:hypothetical protein
MHFRDRLKNLECSRRSAERVGSLEQLKYEDIERSVITQCIQHTSYQEVQKEASNHRQ